MDAYTKNLTVGGGCGGAVGLGLHCLVIVSVVNVGEVVVIVREREVAVVVRPREHGDHVR